MVNLRFLCASYRSLYLLSSIKMLSLCHLLFVVTPKIIPTCVLNEKSFRMQSYKTHIFQNAYIFSSKLVLRIITGLNLTHLIHSVCTKMSLMKTINIQSAPNGIGLILAARIKGHMKTRFVPKLNALCVSSFSNRILDCGYIRCRSSLGLVGVKVGTILWRIVIDTLFKKDDFFRVTMLFLWEAWGKVIVPCVGTQGLISRSFWLNPRTIPAAFSSAFHPRAPLPWGKSPSI